MWTIFKVFIGFITILFLSCFYVLVLWLWAMWDLISPTKDQTHISRTGRENLNHWATREIPICIFKKKNMIPHMSDIIWYLSLSVWLTLLSMLISKSTHVAANGIISFLYMVWYYSFVYMHYIFINSSVYGHIGYCKQCCKELWGACTFSDHGFLQI